MSFLFAKREKEAEDTPTRVPFLSARTSRERILWACFVVIVVAVGVALVGAIFKFTVWVLTPLYIAEVASVWAFGLAWLLKSRDLWPALRHGVKVKDTRNRPPDAGKAPRARATR